MNAHSVISQYIYDNPKLASYILDLDFNTVTQSLSGIHMRPDNAAVSYVLEFAGTIIKFNDALTMAVERGKKNGAEIISNCDVEISLLTESFRAAYKSTFNELLIAQSHCISWHISGPARYPVAKQRTLSNRADAKREELNNLYERRLKRGIEQLLPWGDGSVIRSDDPNAISKLEQKIEQLNRSTELMKITNKIIRKYYKSGNSENVSTEAKEKCINEIVQETGLKDQFVMIALQPSATGKVRGFEQYSFQSNRAAVKSAQNRIREIEALNQSGINIEFDNGIHCYVDSDKKIVIRFGYKPEPEIHSLLRKRAFKYSFKREAYVRKFTLNALNDFETFIKPKLKNL